MRRPSALSFDNNEVVQYEIKTDRKIINTRNGTH